MKRKFGQRFSSFFLLSTIKGNNESQLLRSPGQVHKQLSHLMTNFISHVLRAPIESDKSSFSFGIYKSHNASSLPKFFDGFINSREVEESRTGISSNFNRFQRDENRKIISVVFLPSLRRPSTDEKNVDRT